MSTSPGARPASARRTVAHYSDYAEAERAVDWLSDEGFAVEHVAIVGSGLRLVEQVGGRMTTARAALEAAGQGALIGVLFAIFFGLFFTGPNFLGLLIYAIIAGLIFGAIFGALGQGAMRGRRDFSSTLSTQADRYEVQVEDGVADEAERLLATMSARER